MKTIKCQCCGTELSICPECGTSFPKRNKKERCSDACRLIAHRRAKREKKGNA